MEQMKYKKRKRMGQLAGLTLLMSMLLCGTTFAAPSSGDGGADEQNQQDTTPTVSWTESEGGKYQLDFTSEHQIKLDDPVHTTKEPAPIAINVLKDGNLSGYFSYLPANYVQGMDTIQNTYYTTKTGAVVDATRGGIISKRTDKQYTNVVKTTLGLQDLCLNPNLTPYNSGLENIKSFYDETNKVYTDVTKTNAQVFQGMYCKRLNFVHRQDNGNGEFINTNKPLLTRSVNADKWERI